MRRKRPNGRVEEFGNPRDVVTLLHEINTKERGGRVKSRLEWARKIHSYVGYSFTRLSKTHKVCKGVDTLKKGGS